MFWQSIVDKAKSRRARIAIGAGEGYEEKTIEGAAIASGNGYAEVAIVSSKPLKTGLRNVVSEGSPERTLVTMLKENEIDGIVRGSIGSAQLFAELKSCCQIKKIMRVALLRAPSGRHFFFAPVGVDEGWTVRERIRFGELGAQLMKRFGIEADIGILSGGRLDDRKRSRVVEKTLDSAEKIVETLLKKGFKAADCQILFEDAVKRHNYIIAPDGISGNLMYRSLCLVGGGQGIGAPHVGTDIIYVDTSRADTGYENAICLASALVSAR